MPTEMRQIAGLNCAVGGDAQGRPTLLLHGWGCDHTFLSPQFDHLARTARVLAPDLPGHGCSPTIDDPSVVNISRSIEDLCDAQCVKDALIVGHSMGGTVALEMSKSAPHLVAAIVFVDTVLWPEIELLDAIHTLSGALAIGQREEALRIALQALVKPDDDQSVSDRFRRSFEQADFETLQISFSDHLINYDPSFAAAALRKPVAYIGSESPFASIAVLKSKLPHTKAGQVLGSGHFAPLLVPSQVNAMLDAFRSKPL